MRRITLLRTSEWRLHRLPRQILTLCIALISFAVQAQSQVSGKVTDETGAGMPGVNVVEKATTNGTTTDASGDFSISVANSQATLIFSFIGYSTKEVVVGSQSTISVTLEPSAESLGEIIVTGYGVQQKRDITGAIVKVSSETLLQTASPNVLDQLKGRAAGVDIVSASAVPGGGYQIRIRGNRTMVTGNDINGDNSINQPLLVVDGIPYNGNLNDISPNDISSLEILKDASATAIYGSRGSGGVILVTTKRGSTGKTLFSYDAYQGTSTVMDELRVYNGTEYAAFKAEATAGNSLNPGTTAYALTADEQAALTAGISTNWQDLIYRKAPISNHNLSVSGGTDNSKYSLSAGYFLQGGIIPNQDYTRYSIRSTMDHKLNDRISIGINTMNTLSYQNTPGGAGVPGGLMRLTPLAKPYNDDGTVNLQPQLLTVDGQSINPLTLKTNKEAILAKTRRLRTFNSLYGEVKIIDGLKYRVNVGLDFYQDQSDSYSGPATFVNTSLLQSQSQGSNRNTENYQLTLENLLIFEKTFKEHKIGFTGLYSVQKNHAQGNYQFGQGVPFDYMQNTNLYQASITNLGTSTDNFFSERGLISYMGRINYSYSGRYSLTATVRRDGSSVLSSGSQYYTYPAFGVAWNISNENFMSGLTFINELKLRGGWGITASQGINPYSTLGGLSSSAYNFGVGASGQQIGYLVTNLPNSSLKWQSTAQTNIGLDFAVLKNRLKGSMEFYFQETDDILLPVSLPPSNGAPSTVQNIGNTKGHGFELTLSSQNLTTASGLTWTTDFNYFFNREEIVSLAGGASSDIGNGWFVGQPLTVIYDYKKIGIWQTNDDFSAQTSPTQKPGQIKVLDWNSSGANKPGDANYGVPDGKITAEDRMILGNFQPKFDAGLTNNLSFKGIDFSISIYARVGMKMLVPYVSSEPNGSNTAGYSFFNQSRVNQIKTDYWTPTNPTNAFPRPDAAVGAPLYSSTLSYMDGSFVKCRSINLGYNIPSSLLRKVGVTSLKVYVSVVNPFVIYSPFVKDGFGPDPEGNGYGGGVNASGTSNAVVGRQISVNANNPSTRQFMFGLNLKF